MPAACADLVDRDASKAPLGEQLRGDGQQLVSSRRSLTGWDADAAMPRSFCELRQRAGTRDSTGKLASEGLCRGRG